MFRCDVCASLAPPRTSCNRLVAETRPADYPARAKAHWHPPRAGGSGGSGKWTDDPGGHGTEIARELRACAPCAAKASAIERRGTAGVL